MPLESSFTVKYTTGSQVTVVDDVVPTNVPEEFSLIPNYPNPFNPTTTIGFALPKTSHVNLTIYDLQGRLVTELVNGLRDAGVHEITWDASDLASGLYFYRILAKPSLTGEAREFTAVKKMLLMK